MKIDRNTILMALAPLVHPSDLGRAVARAMKSAMNREKQRRGRSSYGKPHQSARECSRRVAQMARGMIHA